MGCDGVDLCCCAHIVKEEKKSLASSGHTLYSFIAGFCHLLSCSVETNYLTQLEMPNIISNHSNEMQNNSQAGPYVHPQLSQRYCETDYLLCVKISFKSDSGEIVSLSQSVLGTRVVLLLDCWCRPAAP